MSRSGTRRTRHHRLLFPDTSDQYLATLRRTAYKNAVNLYSIAVRIRLAQPTPELQRAEFES